MHATEVQVGRRKVAQADARVKEPPPAGWAHLRANHLEVVHVRNEEQLHLGVEVARGPLAGGLKTDPTYGPVAVRLPNVPASG